MVVVIREEARISKNTDEGEHSFILPLLFAVKTEIKGALNELLSAQGAPENG